MTRPLTEARRRQLAALEAHREATQFQPLDPGSPSSQIAIRLPSAVLEQVEVAAAAAGSTRSAWLRGAIERALIEAALAEQDT